MKFYNKLHAYYSGIPLYAKTMYICIQGKNGEILVHRNIRACPEVFLFLLSLFYSLLDFDKHSCSLTGFGQLLQ